MADVVTVAEAKLHLRVTQSSEDTLIQGYIYAAQAHIRNLLNRRIPGEDYSTPNVPYPIKQAAYLLVGDMYANREGQTETEIKENPAVMNLLFPYRVDIGV